MLNNYVAYSIYNLMFDFKIAKLCLHNPNDVDTGAAHGMVIVTSILFPQLYE